MSLVDYVPGFACKICIYLPLKCRAEQKLVAICNTLTTHNLWLEMIPVSEQDVLLYNCSLKQLEKVTSAICEIVEWFEGWYNRCVPLTDCVIIVSRCVEQLASLTVTGSSDALKRIDHRYP